MNRAEVFAKGLSCLPFKGKPPSLRTKGRALELAFADAAADSKTALFFDWKITSFAVLDELGDFVAPHLYADVSETEAGTLDIEVDDGQSPARRVSVADYRSLSREQLVAAFLALWPADWHVFALSPYDRSDTAVYLVLNAQQLHCLQRNLGQAFSTVLRDLRLPG